MIFRRRIGTQQGQIQVPGRRNGLDLCRIGRILIIAHGGYLFNWIRPAAGACANYIIIYAIKSSPTYNTTTNITLKHFWIFAIGSLMITHTSIKSNRFYCTLRQTFVSVHFRYLYIYCVLGRNLCKLNVT